MKAIRPAEPEIGRRITFAVQRRLATLLVPCLTACTVPTATTEAPASGGRPLEVLPPGFDAALVRADLLSTARERFGAAAVEAALAAPAHLIVKRFAGLPPPPPPGAGADWRAPTPSAVLVRDGGIWRTATAEGWRRVQAEAAAELDALLSDAHFWSEPAYVPPCPDAGASLLLLKLPGRSETVRNSTCTSLAERVVSAALRG